jgi:hypothetical protein
VATDVYGNRWGDHPDNERIEQYYELLIDSSVESGDLMKDGGIYAKLAPHALVTLDNDRQEKERHAESTRIQGRVVWLTFVLAILAHVK